MGMDLCDKCADILIDENKIPPKNNTQTWKQRNCDNCGASTVCFYHASAGREYFRQLDVTFSSVDKRQGLIALKISKNPKTPSELIDQKLLGRAMELHREIKEISAKQLKLQQEKLTLLEENRNLRIKLDELEEKDRGPYQDH